MPLSWLVPAMRLSTVLLCLASIVLVCQLLYRGGLCIFFMYHTVNKHPRIILATTVLVECTGTTIAWANAVHPAISLHK